MDNRRNIPGKLIGRILIIIFGFIILLVVLNLAGNFFYLLSPVEEQEVGLRFRNRQIYEVIGPGVYNDVGIYVDLQTISTQAIPFEARDEEIITSDKQLDTSVTRPLAADQVSIFQAWTENVTGDNQADTQPMVSLQRYLSG